MDFFFPRQVSLVVQGVLKLLTLLPQPPESVLGSLACTTVPALLYADVKCCRGAVSLSACIVCKSSYTFLVSSLRGRHQCDCGCHCCLCVIPGRPEPAPSGPHPLRPAGRSSTRDLRGGGGCCVFGMQTARVLSAAYLTPCGLDHWGTHKPDTIPLDGTVQAWATGSPELLASEM